MGRNVTGKILDYLPSASGDHGRKHEALKLEPYLATAPMRLWWLEILTPTTTLPLTTSYAASTWHVSFPTPSSTTIALPTASSFYSGCVSIQNLIMTTLTSRRCPQYWQDQTIRNRDHRRLYLIDNGVKSNGIDFYGLRWVCPVPEVAAAGADGDVVDMDCA